MYLLRRFLWIGLAVGGLACTPTQPAARPVALPAIPQAAEGRFTVLVADFEGDTDDDADQQGDTTQKLVTALETFSPLEPATPPEAAKDMHPDVLRLHRFVSPEDAPTNVDPLYHRHELAREWLVKTGAHLIVWGHVTAGHGSRIELRITGLRDRVFGQAFPLAQEFSIPWQRFSEARPLLFLALAAEVGGYEDLRGLGLQDELVEWLAKVEDLSPLMFGDLEVPLAVALQARAARTGEPALLIKAAVYLLKAEEKRSRKKDPVGWARLVAMRGHVRSDREALQIDSETVRAILQNYSDAAQELTQSRAPLDYGLLQNLLGKSQERLAEHLQDKAPLCFAANSFWKAAHVTYDGAVPRYMDASLRGVRRSLSSLTQGLPFGQKPECNPPIEEALWNSYQAAEIK